MNFDLKVPIKMRHKGSQLRIAILEFIKSGASHYSKQNKS